MLPSSNPFIDLLPSPVSRVVSLLALSKNSLVLMFCFALVACGGDQMSDLREFVGQAYQNEKPEIEPLPEIQPFIAYEYSGSDLPNPFSPLNIVSNKPESAAIGESPDANRRKEPLEEYPLDALRMVGTLTLKETPWVIVQTSDGIAYRATIGNYIGQNDGKITQIILDEQKVVLEELVIDAVGRWVTKERELTIDE